MVEQTGCAVVAHQCLRCLAPWLLEPGDGANGGAIGILDLQRAAAKLKEVVATAIQVFEILDLRLAQFNQKL